MDTIPWQINRSLRIRNCSFKISTTEHLKEKLERFKNWWNLGTDIKTLLYIVNIIVYYINVELYIAFKRTLNETKYIPDFFFTQDKLDRSVHLQ